MVDLLLALAPIISRVRQDVTWRKVGKSIVCDKKTPLGTSVLRRHLRGHEMRGVCPILEGESTVRVAVLDLDSHHGETEWEEMTFVCAKVCEKFSASGYHPVPFRSTGGRGVHIFFIWDAPQDAYSVRRFMVSHLNDIGFQEGSRGVSFKEIEIFPKQDAVPKGGFGNQFILPLAGFSAPLEPLFDYEVQPREAALNIVWTPSPDVPFIEKQKIERPEKSVNLDTLSLELKRMLDTVPNPEANYDLWIRIGMALHAETDGSIEGLYLWEEWSARCPEYSGFEELEYKWNSFRNDKDKIVALGTLKKIAADHGWQEDYTIDFEEIPQEDDEIVADKLTPPKLPEKEIPAPLQTSKETLSEPPQKIDRFLPIRVDKYLTRKPPRWIIKGLLPEQSTSMTYGGSGDGKTFVILDMACAIALGKPWLGRKTRQGHVVYICAEGAGGFTSRVRAYALHHEIDIKKLGDNLSVIPASPNFMQKKDVEELILKIKSYNKRTDLIVVDTMAQTTTGADENSAKDMNIALKYLEALRAATGAAAHLIHHAGKDEERGARGSTTLKAALDVQFQVSREGENRLFWVRKMKDGIDNFGHSFTLASQTIGTDEDGDMVTSCYVEYQEQVLEHRPTGKKKRSYEMNVVLKTWQELGGRIISINDLASAAISRIPHVDGTKDTRLKNVSEAIAELTTLGELTVMDGQIIESLDAGG